jgi:hypothetical protein
MSGGSYDYAYARVQDMASSMLNRDASPLRVAFARHLKKVADAMQAVEWVDSCDSARGDEDEPIRACIASGAEAEAAREALELAMRRAEEVLGRMLKG